VRESGATAVVDYEHWTAIRVLQQLWREGVSVPREVSVGTFNDAYPVDAVTPGLTTVGMPAMEVAEAVVGMLMEGVEGAGSGVRRVEFGMKLVVRESTGVVRG
jgi:LacI family transcriptional regulator